VTMILTLFYGATCALLGFVVAYLMRREATRLALRVSKQDRYIRDLFERVRFTSGIGRVIWYEDRSLWLDNTSRRMMGLSVLDHEPTLDERVAYMEWASLVASDAALLQSQLDVAKSLADGGANHLVVPYKNGSTLYAVGTGKANGYAWVGLNIDVTVQGQQIAERVLGEGSPASLEQRYKAQVDHLTKVLDVAANDSLQSLMARSEQQYAK